MYEKSGNGRIDLQESSAHEDGKEGGGSLYEEHCTGQGLREWHLPFVFLSDRRHGGNLVMRCGLEAFRPQAAFALQGEKL